MAVLVTIAGTDETYLTEGMSLAEILDGYNKYSQATSIYNEFNTNLPDGFLDTDLNVLLNDLAGQSETPEGPSYSTQGQPAQSSEDNRGDPVLDYKGDPVYDRSVEETTIGAIRAADYMSGYAPLPVKVIGAMLGGIFGKASEEQQKLADAIDNSEEVMSFEERGEMLRTLEAAEEKYATGVSSTIGGVMKGFLTGGVMGLGGSLISSATKNKVGRAVDTATGNLIGGGFTMDTGLEGSDSSSQYSFNKNLPTGNISFGGLNTVDYSSTSDNNSSNDGSRVRDYGSSYTTDRGVEVVEKSSNVAKKKKPTSNNSSSGGNGGNSSRGSDSSWGEGKRSSASNDWAGD